MNLAQLGRLRLGPIVILIGLGISWGATIPLTKVAVSTGHAPLGLIFWQLAITTVILGVLLLAARIPVPVNRRSIFFYGGVGLLGTVAPNSFSYTAAVELPAGVMGIVLAGVPIWSLLLALGLRLESFDPVRGAGVLAGATAMILIAGPDTALPDPEKAVFVLLAMAATICYGGEGHFIVAFTPPKLNPLAALFGASLLSAVFVGPSAWLLGDWVDMTVSWQTAEWALFCSTLAHVVAYSGFIWLIGKTGAVFASQVAYIVTIAAVLLSVWFLDERYSTWIWGALLLMIVGLALVRPREPTHSRQAEPKQSPVS